jgi:hypothetical protein
MLSKPSPMSPMVRTFYFYGLPSTLCGNMKPAKRLQAKLRAQAPVSLRRPGSSREGLDRFPAKPALPGH